ncbi:hypothetical protein H8959_019298 [Pygathrix nigripes]
MKTRSRRAQGGAETQKKGGPRVLPSISGTLLMRQQPEEWKGPHQGGESAVSGERRHQGVLIARMS